MKLTKEDIDKVRHIEGFPIGKHRGYYCLIQSSLLVTARPNPFIEDFIKEHGKPYDEGLTIIIGNHIQQMLKRINMT